jgi:L,D-transpeptidase YcbB
MKVKKIKYAFIYLLITLSISMYYECSSKKSKDKLSDRLSAIIKTFKQVSPVHNARQVYNPDIITRLYEKGGPFFSSKFGDRNKTFQMIYAIRNASQDGLNPADYHLHDIEKLVDKIAFSKKVEVEDVASLELMLTDSFLLLASHLAIGKTDPETINTEWDISRRNTDRDWNKYIDSTLKSNDLIGALENLTPRHPEYNNLKKALARYRFIESEGGWDSFTSQLPKLEKGMRHPDVALLRKRLAITQGDIYITPGNEDLFDDSLKKQVVIFQLRNSLTSDGVAGKTTFEALNVPVSDRIQTLAANLERWRWTSDDLGKRYIKVNIASFDLEVIDNNKPVFQSLAVVGQPFKQTPVFSSMLKYLVLNPDWTIPPDIIKNEIISIIKKNPAYLAKNNMKVLRTDGTAVDSSSISWGNVIADNFPYMIRQDPGPGNALGKIAFMFPNKYFVYIHDTPSKHLFSQSTRAFSHGCIRINKAFELAEYILKDQPGWDSLSIQKAIGQGAKRIINLQNQIPVHILYLTARADDEGMAYFSKDIYDRDKQLIKALNQVPPESDNK